MLVALLWPVATLAADPRVCGLPTRDAAGKIVRSAARITEFKRVYACPSNGKHSGPCPGWSIDHVIPLVCGGCDDISNMQWLPNQIKSAAGVYPKDRWEQRVYCRSAD